MQKDNVNLPINITSRSSSIIDDMKDYALKKVSNLHLDYPKIIEAKVILEIEKKRNISEIILFCANHIVIEADSQADSMYASIDDTISKISRRMRKYKTRMLKSHRPKPKDKEIRYIKEFVYPPDLPEESDQEEYNPLVIDEEYKLKDLYVDEAIMDMEMNEKSFILFNNSKTDSLSVLYKKQNGNYGLISPN